MRPRHVEIATPLTTVVCPKAQLAPDCFPPLLLIALTSASALLATPAVAQSNQNSGFWTQVSATAPMGRDLLGSVEVQGRFNDDAAMEQRILRLGVGYRASPGATVWAGYHYQGVERDGQPGTTEHRGGQQVSLNIGPAFSGAFSARTRLEQRFVRSGDDVGWRLRQQLRYDRPIGRDPDVSFVAHAEVFVAMNDTDWGASGGFDRIRSFVGVAIPVRETVSLEIGYLNQLDDRAIDRIDHVLSLSMVLRP